MSNRVNPYHLLLASRYVIVTNGTLEFMSIVRSTSIVLMFLQIWLVQYTFWDRAFWHWATSTTKIKFGTRDLFNDIDRWATSVYNNERYQFHVLSRHYRLAGSSHSARDCSFRAQRSLETQSSVHESQYEGSSGGNGKRFFKLSEQTVLILIAIDSPYIGRTAALHMSCRIGWYENGENRFWHERQQYWNSSRYNRSSHQRCDRGENSPSQSMRKFLARSARSLVFFFRSPQR